MSQFFDTIVAPITGTQKAAVAVLRVSGPGSFSVASKVFLPWPENPETHKAIYGHYINGDDGLALPFAEGKSYTGEQAVELSVHGSHVSVRSLLEACYQAGARPAGPGEFTLRAFLNGRIDLTQAEGVRLSVDALTDAQFRAAAWMREGRLFSELDEIAEGCAHVLTSIEASTDFSEEIGPLDRNEALARLRLIKEKIRGLLQTSKTGKIVENGLTIALIGLPNAGKSSLLNAILGMDRAIVTNEPGTTRDTIEEMTDIGGVPCKLIDTAGLRETSSEVERIGVDRALRAAQQADIVWYVFDSAKGWTEDDQALFAQLSRPATIIANKTDLADNDRGVSVSTKTCSGLDVLVNLVKDHAGINEQAELRLINRRHEPLLSAALRSIEDTESTLSQPVPDDLAAVTLRAALHRIGEITGKSAAHDVIERIFSQFCVGK